MASVPSRTICLRCRSLLTRPASRRAATPNPPQTTTWRRWSSSTDTDTDAAPLPSLQTETAASRSRPSAPRSSHPPFASPPPPGPPRSFHDFFADRLARKGSSKQRQHQRNHQRNHQPQESIIADATIYDKALQLDTLQDPVLILSFVKDELWGYLRSNPGRHASIVSKVTKALEIVVAAKARRPADPTLPSMLHISQVLASVSPGIESRVKMILNTLEHLAAPTINDQANDWAKEQYNAMLGDILDVWKHLTVMPVQFVKPGNKPEWNLSDTFGVTAADIVAKAQASDARKDARKDGQLVAVAHALWLNALFPGYSLGGGKFNNLHVRLNAALIGTILVLRDPDRQLPDDLIKDAEPLDKRVTHMITSLGITLSHVSSQFNVWPALDAFTQKHWERIALDPQNVRELWVDWFIRMIGIAHISRNVTRLESIWNDFEASVRLTKTEQRSKLTELVDVALAAACDNKRLNLRQQILEFADRRKIALTTKTYTIMLKGFKKARMARALMEQWDMAVKSGVQFDTHIWSAWISGLIECGEVARGLQAIRQMVELWERQAKDPKGCSPHAVQLSITPINAAIWGLFRRGQPDAAKELLDWAASKGIQADIFTFNGFLKEVLHTGDWAAAEQLMAMMKSADVKPDIATYGMIVSHNLTKSAAAATSADQAETVRRIFETLEKEGIRPNSYFYADLLKALTAACPEGPGSDEAVEVVREHMRRTTDAETPQILTMLAQRELRREPPDPIRIRELTSRRGQSWLGYMDNGSWEHVIMVLATAEPDSTELLDEALGVFLWLHKSGRWAGLHVKKVLLEALTRQRRWKDAGTLVKLAVEQHQTIVSEMNSEWPSSKRYNDHGFWALAKGYGYMDE